jgi:transcriptional regulator with XRE-family HTH domain
MQRPSVYPYMIKEPPGVDVHRLRNTLGWSMRELADRCQPKHLDHTTIRRLEHNEGFTQDTVERVAKALGVTRWQDLFLPPELAIAGWSFLPNRDQSRVAKLVQDAYLARRHRVRAPKR